jgi:hypothetical protein
MFILNRIISTGNGTFGALIRDDQMFCMTLEPPIPKLPAGTYKCELYDSPKRGYKVYKIDFPQEDGIPLEIHIGNTIADTTGCILVGGFDPSWRYDDMPGVFNSKMAFDMLMETKLPCFWLQVIE